MMDLRPNILKHDCIQLLRPISFPFDCTAKTLRFSDLLCMSDYRELSWGYHILGLAAQEIAKENATDDGTIDNQHYERLAASLGSFQSKCLPTAVRFSKSGDSLSQWRTYADDARGFAIGFDLEMLKQMPSPQLDVVYDQETQLQRMRELLKRSFPQNKNLRDVDIWNKCPELYILLASFKNPSFVEEVEVRLLHTLKRETLEGVTQIAPAECISFGQQKKSPDIQFRMKAGVPIPFVDIQFQEDSTDSPLKKVVLGPMNIARIESIQMFLATIGFPNVEVSLSSSSYRNPHLL